MLGCGNEHTRLGLGSSPVHRTPTTHAGVPDRGHAVEPAISCGSLSAPRWGCPRDCSLATATNRATNLGKSPPPVFVQSSGATCRLQVGVEPRLSGRFLDIQGPIARSGDRDWDSRTVAGSRPAIPT
ncbi:unnamed protein product, partial [Iphiclides podalirius]